MTPAMVHHVLAPEVRENRQLVLDAACAAHPATASQGGLDQQTPKLRRKYSLNSVSERLKVVDTRRIYREAAETGLKNRNRKDLDGV
jgi:hypothetical protein